ncbi:hypothetical protein AVEN_164839-1 [Araneus ventricosus]|uniref:Uncharacterized protein n=1 Tax=Araneus ventricosus TaxID=182803 RepID=A0A4Y2ITB1_ARAVE|nr:hypothetical protein AVEN_164839-1 [Araneus ventricosus]
MDFAILNLCQMTRTATEPTPPTPSSRTSPAGGPLIHDVRFGVHLAYIHCETLKESGFEPVTFRPRSRYLSIKPSRSSNI